MSKQSNQKYRKELNLNHKERAKDTTSSESTNKATNDMKNMPSREGYGDGNPDGSNSTNQNKRYHNL